jgi:hypothetical protein
MVPSTQAFIKILYSDSDAEKLKERNIQINFDASAQRFNE